MCNAKHPPLLKIKKKDEIYHIHYIQYHVYYVQA